VKQFFSVGITLDYQDGYWRASASFSQLGAHGQVDAIEGEIRNRYPAMNARLMVMEVKQAVERFGIEWGVKGSLPFLAIEGEGDPAYQVPDGWLDTFQAIAAELEWETYRQEEDCTC
jgi:hypothetical protein